MRSSIPAAAPALLSRRQWLGLPVLVLPVAATAGYNFWTGEYTLSHHDLQAQVEKKFPLKLRYSELFEVRLTDPVLSLDAGSNRATLAREARYLAALSPKLDSVLVGSSLARCSAVESPV